MVEKTLRVPKLLTPVDLGSLTLRHRVIVLVPPTHVASSYSRHVPPGGMVIQAFAQNGDIPPDPSREQPSGPKIWKQRNESVRTKGGTSIAQIGMTALDTPPAEAEAELVLALYRNHAKAAVAAGFDGIELDAARYAAINSADRPGVISFLETVQTMIDVWGADRVGVQLAPFAWMNEWNDTRAAEDYVPLLCALAEMEIAYVHLAGTATPDRGDLSTSPLGQRLRQAFPGMLVASGDYTPATAIAAVDSRWADAIGFTLITGRGDELVRAITAVATASNPRRP